MLLFNKLIRHRHEIALVNIEFEPDLILIFASFDFENLSCSIQDISKKFKNAIITGCTSNGIINSKGVNNSVIAITALKFTNSSVALYTINLSPDSCATFECGSKFINKIEQDNLKHIFLLSDQHLLIEQEFLDGMNANSDAAVSITGGLSSNSEFDDSKGLIINGKLDTNKAIAVAFYGESLKVGYHAVAGWNSYGSEHLVTNSSEKKILEIDDQPALDWYNSHFNENDIKKIKNIGIKYPIKIRNSENTSPVLRSPEHFDESDKSINLLSDISKGSYIRVMKADKDRVINGAENAAKKIIENYNHQHELAILISCKGRKLLLNGSTSEEVEAVVDQFPESTITTGFYSNGEISPFYKKTKCSYHNLTMCITTISEQ